MRAVVQKLYRTPTFSGFANTDGCVFSGVRVQTAYICACDSRFVSSRPSRQSRSFTPFSQGLSIECASYVVRSKHSHAFNKRRYTRVPSMTDIPSFSIAPRRSYVLSASHLAVKKNQETKRSRRYARQSSVTFFFSLYSILTKVSPYRIVARSYDERSSPLCSMSRKRISRKGISRSIDERWNLNEKYRGSRAINDRMPRTLLRRITITRYRKRVGW